VSDPYGWANGLLAWYQQEKRDLPWRRTKDPYAIWISEIMLQQTRVETVKEYYRRFIARFPDVAALAQAPEEDVLKLWEGLGYYSRARNLQKAAKSVVEQYNGQIPSEYEMLKSLPGIGEYTAGAIASIAFGIAVPAIDGNVFRVAARFYGERENIELPQVRKKLRALLTQAVSQSEPDAFNQAMMELGATLCVPRAPRCDLCPLKSSCDAYAEGDAESLPVHEKKQPAKVVQIAVGLLCYQDRIAMFRRRERLLNGLYVFYLAEEETDPQRIAEQLSQDGLAVDSWEALGKATHVFTHRIWQMTLYRFSLDREPGEQWLTERDGVMADEAALQNLPLPTAMKAAKAEALKLLQV
jgi:A/G-specific adenine glycosylase